ncbi:MAG: hydantoinase/carbamoylase family amidase [Betaproteobacteria bacterium]
MTSASTMDALDVAHEAAALVPAAAELFAELRTLSADGEGVTREAYGPRETAAQEVIARFARNEGLDVARDGASNLVVALRGSEDDGRFLAVGSHLDSVPFGGNYDGAAGVVAGLLALVMLRRSSVTPPRSVRLFALRAEESAWFGKSWIGAHAMLGMLRDADLAQRRADTGRALVDHLRDVGADVAALSTRTPLVSREAVAAFVEVHIEQGPVLEARRVPLGIVTSIYGNLRHRRIVCRGEAAHAGATPRELRRDAAVAAADFIVRLDARWAEWLAAGRHITVTHGVVGTDPREHAISRVAGAVDLSLEIRAEDAQTLRAFHELAREEAIQVSAARGVAFDFDDPIVNAPAAMEAAWVDRLEALCREERIACLRMPSGAGHDAAVFAQAGIPTAMLFIRNQFGSHNPREAMGLTDFSLALRVLVRALLAPVDDAR